MRFTFKLKSTRVTDAVESTTYVFEAGVIVFANVVQFVDEEVVLCGQKVDRLSQACPREIHIVVPLWVLE